MLEILHYDFMIRALEAGIALGITYPILGVFLVLRRYAFMADTLAHISLAGVALGLWLGVAAAFSPLLTISVALLGAMIVDKLRSSQKLSAEALLALVMSGGVALAVVLFGLSRSAPVDITSYLFGSLLTVTSTEVKVILTVSSIVLLVVTIFFKEFFFVCYHEELARASGLPVDQLNTAFILMMSVAVAVGLRVVGSLLVSALIVIPVLTALLISSSFRQVIWFSLGIGLFSSIIGLTSSYFLGLATGGCIALTTILTFVAVLAGKNLVLKFSKKRITANTDKPM
jgi:zinc transport system permease protein